MENSAGFETLTPAMADVQKYFDWIYAQIAPHLGRRVLEVGPGFGNLAERIVASGRDYFSIDLDQEVIRLVASRLRLPLDRCKVGDITEQALDETVLRWSPDTLVSMNVLEHVKEDRAHLKALFRFSSLRKMILFVPALPILYGTFDRQAGHFRRYLKNELQMMLEELGASNIQIHYFNFVGALAWWVSGRFFHCRLNSERTNHSVVFYDRWVIPLARLIDPVFRRLGGQSLIAFATLNGKMDAVGDTNSPVERLS
jgi:SAM-dependent methyltransferase